MSSEPRVSVLMGVHNGERYLRSALESVLSQTLPEIELIVVDDASTDGTAQLLEALHDPRLLVIRNRENLGLTRSLNKGLQRVRGRYVARLDADDLMTPERLAKQLAHLDAHPDVALLGTRTIEVDAAGAELRRPDTFHKAGYLRWALAFENPVYHPTMMFRREVVNGLGGYNDAYAFAQDHELCTRIVLAGGAIEILPERLTRYRRSGGQISTTRAAAQWDCGLRARVAYLRGLLGDTIGEDEAEGMRRLLRTHEPEPSVPRELDAALALLHRLYRACAHDADSESREQIRRELLNACILHARMDLGDRHRPDRAERIVRSTLRLGLWAWKDRRLWSLLPAIAAARVGRSAIAAEAEA